MAISKDKTSHPKKGLDKKALIEGKSKIAVAKLEFTFLISFITCLLPMAC
jgi:hypothetical protein